MPLALARWTLLGTVLLVVALPVTFDVGWQAGAVCAAACGAAWSRSIVLYYRLIAEVGCTLNRSPDP